MTQSNKINRPHYKITKGGKSVYCCAITGKIIKKEKETESEKNKYFYLFNYLLEDFSQSIARKKIEKRELNRTMYYGFNETQIKTGEKILQLDIVQAYYNVAINNGFVSERTQNKVNSLICDRVGDRRLIKEPLNIAIGYAGMSERIYIWKGSDYQLIETKENPLKDIRNKIVSDLSIIMHDLCKRFNLLFFWVDAIFLYESEYSKEIESYLNERYNLSFSKPEKYTSDVKGNKLELININKAERKGFFLPKKIDKLFCKYEKVY